MDDSHATDVEGFVLHLDGEDPNDGAIVQIIGRVDDISALSEADGPLFFVRLPNFEILVAAGESLSPWFPI